MKEYPLIGEYTAWGNVMYRAVEAGDRKGVTINPCQYCDLSVLHNKPCPGIMCHPKERVDGKQVVFVRKWAIKKRVRGKTDK